MGKQWKKSLAANRRIPPDRQAQTALAGSMARYKLFLSLIGALVFFISGIVMVTVDRETGGQLLSRLLVFFAVFLGGGGCLISLIFLMREFIGLAGEDEKNGNTEDSR